MALSEDENTEYSLSDVALTSANAVIMPSGTSSYTVSQNHSVVVVRKVGNIAHFKLAVSINGVGGSLVIQVQPGDIVWDVNQTLYVLKCSTGGNSFVNFSSMLGTIDSGEADGYNSFVWNGDLKIN